jgi:GDPmannose 4,6-dehydratase
MKAIIWGANGQDGFYLKRLLEREKIEVLGISRSGYGLIGDVSDRGFVDEITKANSPDYIFHLAANSTTRHEAVFDNHEAISTGTINILEAACRHSQQSKVFLSGSAMQFANVGTPIDESTPFAPLSPYAVSRIHSVYAGRYYRSLSMKVYVGYFFNHDSPLRAPDHINKKIADAAREGRPIEIGDVTVRKEFNFAGDVVEAVWCLINQDDIFEAVIGSGRAHSIGEWLELCFVHAGKDWQDFVTTNTNFKPEYKILVSNPALIGSLGWRPKVDIDGLARIMMEE